MTTLHLIRVSVFPLIRVLLGKMTQDSMILMNHIITLSIFGI